jgi:hypothetical protein
VTTTIKEVAFALVVVGICWALKHSAPGGRAEMVTFWTVLLLPFVLNVAGWWRWRGVRRDQSMARWRKGFGLGGLVANTLAMCLPFLVFFYNGFLINYDIHHPPGLRGFKQIDLLTVVEVCLLLSLAAVGAGILAPRRIRLMVALGGFTLSSFILSIRMGVL